MEKKVRKEKSFGIIPCRKKNEKWEVLLVLHHAGHWAFPKGHAEIGESPLESATRELFEETSLKVVSLLPFPPAVESYFFQTQTEKVSKQVTYFLATVQGQATPQIEEIAAVRWFSLQEALETITFKELKTLFQKVIADLTGEGFKK